jgi:hypothetical protein
MGQTTGSDFVLYYVVIIGSPMMCHSIQDLEFRFNPQLRHCTGTWDLLKTRRVQARLVFLQLTWKIYKHWQCLNENYPFSFVGYAGQIKIHHQPINVHTAGSKAFLIDYS